MSDIRKKLVVVGDGGCGKTCLLFRYVNKKFLKEYDPTVFETYVTDITVDGIKVEMTLWDTAGQEGYDRLRLLSYKNTSVVLICYSVDSPDSLENVKTKWINEVEKLCGSAVILLIGCKKDLREDPDTIQELGQFDQFPVSLDQGLLMATEIGAYKHLECSALSGEGVDEIFDSATRAALTSSIGGQTNVPKNKKSCVMILCVRTLSFFFVQKQAPFTSSKKKKMSRKKTLGEQLSELANPAPDNFDPETPFYGFSNSAEQSNKLEDSEKNAEFDGNEHYVPVGRSKLRNLIEDLNDKKYSGKRVSRKNMFNEDDDEDFSEEEVADANDEEDDSENEEHDFESDEEIDEDGLQQPGSVSDELEDESDFHEEDADGFEDDNSKNSKIQDQLLRLQQDEQDLVESLVKSAKDDSEKGAHVRAQIIIFDLLLDTRIRLQRALTDSNKLPRPEVFPYFLNPLTDLEINTKEIEQGVKATADELLSLIGDLSSLRYTLIKSTPSMKLDESTDAQLTNLIRKRKRPYETDDASKDENVDYAKAVDESYQLISKLDDAFAEYRQVTIEKWNEKSAVVGTAVAAKKFKAVNLSITSQIDTILSDRERLLKRTRLKRSEYRVLGMSEDKAEVPEERNNAGDDDAVPPPKARHIDAHLKDYDVEVFDDTDFYHQLLKELIESKVSDIDDPIAMSVKWAQLKKLQQQSKKQRANVDRKASKGRKLRYHVHEKIQNFMAPEARGSWHEEKSEELFSGLFGKSDATVTEQKGVENVGEVVDLGGLRLFR
ncbi:GTP-binding protein Rho1 [Nowakowskiella sp. JEL0407]|nr:GTP-binding protein Rho1 [Nowakowskiella sp. JEL0407]